MATVSGRRVVLSETLILGADDTEASVEFGDIKISFRFLNKEAKELSITPMMEGDGVVFVIEDASQGLAYAYEGKLNRDGITAFTVNFFVSPVGAIEHRVRQLSVTIAPVAA